MSEFAVAGLRTLWSRVKESLSQSRRHSEARSSRVINGCFQNGCIKLEFCKSRHGEAIICYCSLFQSAHPSLSTSIVELHASDGSKGVECDLPHGSSRKAAQSARTCRNFSQQPLLFHCSAAMPLWLRAIRSPDSNPLSPRITSLKCPSGSVSRPHATIPQLEETTTMDCWVRTPLTRCWTAKLKASAAVASRRVDKSRF
jgi:hypothetical protein